MTESDWGGEPRFLGAVAVVQGTGAQAFQIRYSDDDEPTVWIAVAEHVLDAAGRPLPAPTPGRQVFTAAAGLSPLDAVLALAEQLLDGGQCVHCGLATAFETGFDLHPWLPMAEAICWTHWDHDSGSFRRACA